MVSATCYNKTSGLENRGLPRIEGPMPNKVSFSMVIHSHQPVGNFDHVIEEAFQKSYKPFIDVLERHPQFMERLLELTQRSQIEHMGGGYFEPILAGIPDAEKVAQIRRQSDF